MTEKINQQSLDKQFIREDIEKKKEKVKKYFSGKYDVTFEKIYKDLSLKPSDLSWLDYILNLLVDEGIINKSDCGGLFEYDWKD